MEAKTELPARSEFYHTNALCYEDRLAAPRGPKSTLWLACDHANRLKVVRTTFRASSKMVETVIIKARLSDGVFIDFPLRISGKPSGVAIQSQVREVQEVVARDLFEALRAVRLILEISSCQLLCAGARIDVWPSGMSRDMSAGRKAYIQRIESPSSFKDLVDIFDYAEADLVGTVAQQAEFHMRWLGARGMATSIPSPD